MNSDGWETRSGAVKITGPLKTSTGPSALPPYSYTADLDHGYFSVRKVPSKEMADKEFLRLCLLGVPERKARQLSDTGYSRFVDLADHQLVYSTLDAPQNTEARE